MDIKKEPLAYRMRPRTLEEFYGQEEIVGEGKLLNRMIKADRISSIILYGPPGTGKTSLARIIANSTKANFEKLNAVTAGVADIKRIVSDTQNPILNPKIFPERRTGQWPVISCRPRISPEEIHRT